MENRNSYKSFFKNSSNSKNTPASKNTSTSSKVSFNNDKVSNKNNMKLIIISLVSVILICIIIYIIITFVHFYNTKCYEKKNFFTYLFDFSTSDVCIQENEPPPPRIIKEPTNPLINFIPTEKKEVFHISNQDYTYDQSKCKCESYGGKLATKAQLTDAYNKGAHWCTYGWTDKQEAYYPVQKCDWDSMKEKNDRLPDNAKTFCGMPGINGGHFANPNLKFGVNCYGIKPKGMITKANAPYCPPMNFCKLETNFEASHKLDTDEISGFNNDKWNAH